MPVAPIRVTRIDQRLLQLDAETANRFNQDVHGRVVKDIVA
jgi:hypothetical protein